VRNRSQAQIETGWLNLVFGNRRIGPDVIQRDEPTNILGRQNSSSIYSYLVVEVREKLQFAHSSKAFNKWL
jgi:hypothetical protein